MVQDVGPLYDGIREAIINSVTYSDTQTEGVLRIDRRDDAIILRNPGVLRISAERIYQGDFTHARNRNIQKMFRMIGFGDNIGSGFQKILKAWQTLGFAKPELKELPDVKEVWLTMPLMGNSHKYSQINSQENTSNKAFNNNELIEKNTIISQINSQINLSVIQREILLHMIKYPMSSIDDIAKALRQKVESIRYQRRIMQDIVSTKKIGSNKKGKWQIVFK